MIQHRGRERNSVVRIRRQRRGIACVRACVPGVASPFVPRRSQSAPQSALTNLPFQLRPAKKGRRRPVDGSS